jgi:hypothetical protein
MGTGTEALVASKKLTVAELGARLAAGSAALLVLALLLLPWYEARYEPKISGLDLSNLGGGSTKRVTAKAWDVSLIGKFVVILGVAALVVAAINLLAPRINLPVRAPIALVVSSAVAAALVVLAILTDPEFGPAPETFTGIPELDAVKFVYHADNQIGIYVSLGISIAIAVAGAVCWAGSRRSRQQPRRSASPPPPPPPPPPL